MTEGYCILHATLKRSHENSSPHPAIKKKKFTEEEDQKLKQLVERYGEKNFKEISTFMEGRTARQLRERYNNYLKSGIVLRPWSQQEDDLLINKYALYGSKWSVIAKYFPGRTDVHLKNRMKYLRSKFNRMSEFSPVINYLISDIPINNKQTVIAPSTIKSSVSIREFNSVALVQDAIEEDINFDFFDDETELIF